MRIISNAYQHLGRFLLDNVKDDQGRPVFHWADMWYEQTEFQELAEAINYPAVFLAFSGEDLTTVGRGEQDVRLLTDIYVAVESLEDTNIASVERASALHYFEICARVHELLQGYEHPSVGSLNRIGFVPVSTRTNLIVYRLAYGSNVFDISPLQKKEADAGVPANQPDRKFFDL